MHLINFHTNRCQFELRFEAVKQKWSNSLEIDCLRFYVGALHFDYYKVKNIELTIKRILKDQNAIPKNLKRMLEDLYFKQQN